MTSFKRKAARAAEIFSKTIDWRLEHFAILEDPETYATVFEGTACRYGHTQRYVSSGNCVECHKNHSLKRAERRQLSKA